jgi:hypothetical protein
MMARRPLALLLLVALFACFAVPTAAFAQSAGDDQYQDPLGGGGGGGSTAPSPAPTPSPSPSPPSSATQAPTPSSAAPSASAADSGSNVPLARTGFDAWVPAVIGVLLLSGGAALLLIPRHRARRR